MITVAPPTAEPATPPPAVAAPESEHPSAARPGTGNTPQHGSSPQERPRPVPPAFKTAEGFGNQVPLSFAVRQIVPKAVKVTYGPGADPASLVDWKGGQAWNSVLLDAVRPLGLRLAMTYMAVEIRR